MQATLGNDKIKSVQTPGSVTSRLDAEMNEILNSPTCKDKREKWTLYRQVLQQYLHFKGNEGGEKYKKERKPINASTQVLSIPSRKGSKRKPNNSCNVCELAVN